MTIQTIFFDLDDTLYRKDSGVWQAMLARIEQYMHERVGIAAEQVPTVRKHYLEHYGTSLRGLMHDYEIDADDYLVYVHDVPIETMIAPNAELDEMLAKLPQRKLIFTNSSEVHARRVLKALGVQAHFDDIVDVKAMQFRSKPDASAFEVALQRGGAAGADAALFVDDHAGNLRAAKELGAATVLVGSGPQPGADRWIERVEWLLAAWPALVESTHVRE